MIRMLRRVVAAAVIALAVARPTRADEPIVADGIGVSLDTIVARSVPFGFSGSVLVARDGTILLAKGYGRADRAQGTPNEVATQIDVASVSKQFTAAAILTLVADGRLGLDDSIAAHLPNVPERHRDVTIRHLLTHTAGFPRMGPTGHGAALAPAMAGYLAGDRPRAAGEAFEYHNGGYAMLAAIVEIVAERPFTDYCRDALFAPAGMHATGFCGAPVDPARVATGYEDAGPIGRADAHSFGWEYRGMGGVISDVLDLYAWDRALRDDTVLGPKAREAMFTPGRGTYGFGWFLRDGALGRLAWHGGTVQGFETQFWRYLDTDAVIIVLSNTRGACYAITHNLAGILEGRGPLMGVPPVVVALDDAALDAFTGTFRGATGRLRIARRDGALDVGLAGPRLVTALMTGGVPGGGGPDLTPAIDRARAILDGVIAGDVEPLRRAMMPDIPAGWPDRVRDELWPEHVATHGAVASVEALGATYQGGPQVISTLFELRHDGGATSHVEIILVGDELMIFDRDARDSVLTRPFAPSSPSTFVTYDFSPFPGPTLEFGWGREGTVSSVTLRFPGGATLEFVCAGE